MCQGQLRNNPVFYLLVVLFWLFKVSCFYCLKCLNLKSPIMYCKVDILEPNDPNNWEWPWCPNSLLTWLGNWVTSMRFPGTLMGKSGLYWQIPWGQRGAQWPGLTHLQFCYKAHDRVFQLHAAECLQASRSGLGGTAAVGRDSPVSLPFQKCCLAECGRAGRTGKLTQVTKSDWTADFLISICFLPTGKTKQHIVYDLKLWDPILPIFGFGL